MEIPKGPSGYPTVSPTMLRRYGSAGFRLHDAEATRGCPRLFRKTYVEHEVPFTSSYELEYGNLIHTVLERLESEDASPEEILESAFAGYPKLGPEAYQEARDDLQRYFERGATPTDRYGMIATERDTTAMLYVDEEFGPIYIRGIFDWLGADLDEPGTLHLVDYKTNRARSNADDVRKDVQVRFYDLLLWLEWRNIMGDTPPNIVLHLDEIKFDLGDIPVRYSDQERDTFQSWLIAVIRHILRDEEGKPRLNPGCAWCPVKASCSAYKKLPDVGQQVLDLRPDGQATSDDDLMSWRDSAWRMKTLLEKACKEIDAEFIEKANLNRGLTLTDYTFTQETEWGNRVDMRALHARLQDQFYDVVTVTKAALERLTKDWDASAAHEVMSLMQRVPVGSSIKKAKTKK